MENKELKERDFHHGEGHSVPIVIRIAWTILITWACFFLAVYCVPDLRMWLNK